MPKSATSADTQYQTVADLYGHLSPQFDGRRDRDARRKLSQDQSALIGYAPARSAEKRKICLSTTVREGNPNACNGLLEAFSGGLSGNGLVGWLAADL